MKHVPMVGMVVTTVVESSEKENERGEERVHRAGLAGPSDIAALRLLTFTKLEFV